MENKCPSYINEKECKNQTFQNRKWCKKCSMIFVKKQDKCKKFEAKYYNESLIVPESDVKGLLKIYSKLKQIIKLRKYVHEQGFNPEKRDDAHCMRIQYVREYKRLVKEEIAKKQLAATPKIDNVETEILDLDNLDLDFEKAEISKKPEGTNVVKKSKKLKEVRDEKEISIIEQEIISEHKLSNIAINFYRDTVNEYIGILQMYLSPRLGKKFLAAFFLQFVAMNIFWKDQNVKETRKYKTRSKLNVELRRIGDEHSYFDKEFEYFYGEKSFISETDTEFKTHMNIYSDDGYHCNTGSMTMCLFLPRLIPNLPLPKAIKSVDFYPTEEVLEGLKKYDQYSDKDQLELRARKIKLITTRNKPDYKYDLQSCIRVNKFKQNTQLGIFLEKTSSPEIYKLYYSSVDPENNVEVSDTSLLDLTNFIIPYTVIPVITLHPDVLGEIDEPDRLKSETIVINLLEAHGMFLFRFD